MSTFLYLLLTIAKLCKGGWDKTFLDFYNTRNFGMATSDTELTYRSVPSPCVRLCTLGDDDICVGCFRSIEEITQWTKLDNTQKLEVIERCNSRRQDRLRV